VVLVLRKQQPIQVVKMAISKIQQSQISGSLSFDDSLAAGSSLASKSTLKGDLDALRSQINKIVGKSNWYDALDGSQDLSDIYAAVHMSGANADFQGTVDVTGAATLDSTLQVAGAADFNGGVSANEIKIDGDNSPGNLYIVGASGEIADSSNLVYDGSKLDITGNLDVSGFADIAGALDVAGIATFDSAISGSAGLEISAGGASIVGGAAITGDLTVSEDLAVLGDASFAGVLDADSLYLANAAGISGSLSVAGAASMASTLDVAGLASLDGGIDVDGAFTVADGSGNVATTGTLDVAGLASLDGGIDVDGAFTVADGSGNVATTGTLDVDGAVGFDSTLDVAGLASLDGGIDVDGAFTVADGSGNVATTGTLDVAGLASLDGGIDVDGAFTVADGSGNVATTGTLDVDGAVDFDSTLDVAGAATFQNGMSVSGAALDVNADLTANKISIDGDTATRLYIVDADGSMKDEQKLTFDGSDLSISGGLRVSGNAQVDGDLLVKGAFTYIETENMKVKDAFIYLATGSAGNVDSGIVLSKGAGAGLDLIVGQDGGAGELIFAQVAHNADGDSPADLAGAALAPAWMSSVKLGGMEGSLSGSLSASPAGVSLSSVADMSIEAADDLSFSANGNSMGLMSAAEYTTFDAAFDATTIVGALNELRSDLDAANAGGNLSKETYDAADFVGNVLSFVGQGPLASADHKLVDVYLNGVLMAKDRDLTGISTTSVTFDSSIVSALVAEDVITVIVRG